MTSPTEDGVRRIDWFIPGAAILTDDVSGTGYRGEYVEIRGGFMRNFLYPAKRAIYATDENRRMYESVDRTAEKERAEALKALKRGRQDLSGLPIIMKRNVPTGGKGGMAPGQVVSAQDVSAYLRKNSPFEVTEEEVRLPGTGKPITTLGTHTVLVRIKVSEAAAAILAEELGAKEFEEQAWVRMKLIVEQMVSDEGAKGKMGREDVQAEEGAEAGGAEEEGWIRDQRVEGGTDGEGEKKGRDMSA